MIKIYNDNRVCIGPIEGYFNGGVLLESINEKCKKYLLEIDRARVVDVNTQTVITPYGACSKERLSSSTKAIIAVYTMLEEKIETPLCIDDCSSEINSTLFDIVEEQSEFKVSFVLHWGNIKRDDKHTFLLNDTIVCNGGAELLRHLDKENVHKNTNTHMEELVFNRIKVSNCRKTAVFDVELKDRYTMIGGKPCTGKSLMWKLLQQTSVCSGSYESLGMNVVYHWEKLHFLDYTCKLPVERIQMADCTLIVIDNFDYLVNRYDGMAEVIMNDSKNQYLILGRNYKAIGLDKKYTGELVNDNGIIKLAYNS